MKKTKSIPNNFKNIQTIRQLFISISDTPIEISYIEEKIERYVVKKDDIDIDINKEYNKSKKQIIFLDEYKKTWKIGYLNYYQERILMFIKSICEYISVKDFPIIFTEYFNDWEFCIDTDAWSYGIHKSLTVKIDTLLIRDDSYKFMNRYEALRILKS